MLGAFDDLKTVPYELLSVPKMEGIYIHATGVHTFFFFTMALCGVYGTCIYLHARWKLQEGTLVFAAEFAWRASSTD